MIAFLKGVLAGKTASTAYLEVNGVGYAIDMSQAALSKLPEAGVPVEIHTYLQVRDDGLSLFGFLSLEEKALFEKLISVSGVGPKMALAALSVFLPTELAAAIASQDITAIQRIPGVGKKTASRIVLELRESVGQNSADLPNSSPSTQTTALKGACEALLSMGFTSAETDIALKGAPKDADEGRLLQYALKRLGA